MGWFGMLATMGPRLAGVARVLQEYMGEGNHASLAELNTRVRILESETSAAIKLLKVITVCVILLFLLSAAFLITGIVLLIRNNGAA